jgi:hypothetical protein
MCGCETAPANADQLFVCGFSAWSAENRKQK